MNVLALAGFKSVGKSFWSKKLGCMIGVSVIDLDELIEDHTGLSVRETYKQLGEESFRGLEFDLIKQLNFQKPYLLSLGGGTLSNKKTLEYIRHKAKIVILEDEFDVIKQRILSESTLWPPLSPNNSLVDLFNIYEDRKQLFKSLELPTFNLSLKDNITALEQYARKFFWGSF